MFYHKTVYFCIKLYKSKQEWGFKVFEDMLNFIDSKTNDSNNIASSNSGDGVLNERELKERDFLTRLTRCGVNLDELGSILNTNSNMLVLSGAGSGKTTSLVLKIIHDLYVGDCYKVMEIPSAYGVNTVAIPANILVTTFLKSGAEELRSSFDAWVAKLGLKGIDSSKIAFRTMHSEVYNALKDMGVTLNILEDNSALIRTVLKKYGVHSQSSRGRDITVDEIRDVECIFAYARNRLDSNKYTHPLMTEYSMDKTLLDAMLNDMKVMRRMQGVLDYEDLQELLLDAMRQNPNVVNFIQSRYDYVYCDEFQDTSQLQYAILQYYFDTAKRIICIGDDDQCIYGWRGSDINIITEYFKEDYKPEIRQLSTNYRCGGTILDCIKPSIERNKNRFTKQLKASQAGGTVDILFDYPVSDVIEKLRLEVNEGRSVGIIARTNNDLIIPAMILEMDGGFNYGLSKSVGVRSKLPRLIFGSIALITRRYSDAFEGYLQSIIGFGYKERHEINFLCDVLRNNTSLSIFDINEKDLDYSAPILFKSFIKPLKEQRAISDKEAYIFILQNLELQFKMSSSVYAKRGIDLINYVINLITSPLCKDLNIYELDKLLNVTLPTSLDRRIASGGSNARIKLTTVHEAKGKEWDTVFIWNDCKDVFPVTVGKRELTVEEYEEERRVHYIAWTRAKSKLFVYSRSSGIGDFLKECDFTGDNVHTDRFSLGKIKLV